LKFSLAEIELEEVVSIVAKEIIVGGAYIMESNDLFWSFESL